MTISEKLEKRARILAATVRLLLALLRASRYRLTGERLPEGETKASILRAITSAQPVLPLNLILRIVGLSPSRYHCGGEERVRREKRPKPPRGYRKLSADSAVTSPGPAARLASCWPS